MSKKKKSNKKPKVNRWAKVNAELHGEIPTEEVIGKYPAVTVKDVVKVRSGFSATIRPMLEAGKNTLQEIAEAVKQAHPETPYDVNRLKANVWAAVVGYKRSGWTYQNTDGKAQVIPSTPA